MTVERNLGGADGSQATTEKKRPWAAPRVIVSELASGTAVVKTSPSPVDHTSPGTTLDGS